MKNKNPFSKNSFIVLTFSILLISLQGCDKGPEIVERITVDENNYTDVYTNNPGLCGYTMHIYTDDLTSFLSDSIKTEVIKLSGYSAGWYGLFFNGSWNADDLLTSFITVLINTDGSYMVIKCVNDTYYCLNGTGSWVTTVYKFASSALVQGYNKSNIIRVDVEPASTYKLYFNKVLANTFTETELTTGLKKGYMFSVSTQDDEGFPDKYLQVKFKELGAL